MDRLSDFKLGMDVVIKANKDWCDMGRRQEVMHSQLPRFLFSFFLPYSLALGGHEEAAPQMYTGGSVVLEFLGHPTGMLECLKLY